MDFFLLDQMTASVSRLCSRNPESIPNLQCGQFCTWKQALFTPFSPQKWFEEIHFTGLIIVSGGLIRLRLGAVSTCLTLSIPEHSFAQPIRKCRRDIRIPLKVHPAVAQLRYQMVPQMVPNGTKRHPESYFKVRCALLCYVLYCKSSVRPFHFCNLKLLNPFHS